MDATRSGLDDFEHDDDDRIPTKDDFEEAAESDEELNPDNNAPSGSNSKKRKYNRHSPHQIQYLEE